MLRRLLPFLAIVAAVATLNAAQSTPPVGVIAGRVVEAGTNAPVPDARVMLGAARPPVPGQMPQQREATSGADGTFRFDGVEAGSYRLIVQKPGYVGGPGSTSPPPMVTLDANKPSASPVITLERGAVIVGRVLSPNGQPAAEARVMVFRKPPGGPVGRLMMGGPPATTNDLGEFRLHSLAAGEYFIQAGPRPTSPMSKTAPSQKTAAPTFYPGTPDALSAQPVSVARGATLSGIEIALVEVPAFSVSGVVVDEAGRPVENASVMLLSDTAPSMPMLNGPGRFRTSADGQFRIDGVIAGTYVAQAAAPEVSKSNANPRTQSGTIGGAVGPLTGGTGTGAGGGARPIGPAYMTETVGGVTTSYRFDQSQQVRIRVESAEVTGLQLIVRRP